MKTNHVFLFVKVLLSAARRNEFSSDGCLFPLIKSHPDLLSFHVYSSHLVKPEQEVVRILHL